MLETLVKSAIFSARGVGKVENGEVQRIAPTVAQTANATKALAESSMIGSKTAQNICSTIDQTAKTSSLWGKTAKAVKWGQTHVNPLIGACVAVNVFTADDKEKAFVEGTAGFSGMLACEKSCKKFLASEKIHKLTESIEKSSKHGKLLASLAKALTFVTASVGGFSLGNATGAFAVDKERQMNA